MGACRRGVCAAALALATVLIMAVSLPPAFAAGVVGTGAPDSCTEAELDLALSAGGNVIFNCGGPTTIVVTSTKTIRADTAIDGGSLMTISGGNSVGVFSVNAGVKFTVQNLTIADGHSTGGGIFNDGGGILNAGTLTVINSTFSGNSAYYGGGIFTGGTGTLTVTNSTFSDNRANFCGGGIYNDFSTMGAVTNSTFSGNSTGGGENSGGGICNYGTLTVTNGTLAGNGAASGGGVYNQGALTATNTIIANSTAGGSCSGAVTDGGHNLDDGTSCGFSAASGSLSSTDPQLDPTGLTDNGGPTRTIALQADSPAINGGDQSVCAATTGTAPVNNLDQRGFVRPGVGHTNCSIGAYEADGAAPEPCVGDCNNDHAVTVDELLTMVNIALDAAPVSACDAGDADHNGHITIDEILTAVNAALNACPK